jgi:hypothetical protein
MPRRNSFLRAAALALAALGALPALRAGTAVRLGTGDLVQRCDLCVEGRVLSARAVAGPGKRIDTEYAIQVERTFWGDALATRTVRLPGGVLPDGSGMIVPGVPTLAVGEDAILFLSAADPAGMRIPIGLAQGKLRVARGAGGRKRLVRDSLGLALVDPAGGPARAAGESAVLDYAAVIADIEAAVAGRRARGR